MTFVGANAMVLGKTMGVYPAAKALMQAVYEGALVPFDVALRIESDALAVLGQVDRQLGYPKDRFVDLDENLAQAVAVTNAVHAAIARLYGRQCRHRGGCAGIARRIHIRTV